MAPITPSIPAAPSTATGDDGPLAKAWYRRPALSPIGSSLSRAGRDASRAVLLAAVSPRPSALASAIDRGAERVDWDWILDRARAHKVAALLASVLDRPEFRDRIPAAPRARLAHDGAVGLHRAELARVTLGESLAALHDRGIDAMVLKGPILAERVYGDPRLRPHSDIDLLVRAADVDRASEALERAGYLASHREAERLGIPPHRCRAFLRRTRHALSHVRRDRMHVELHWALFDPGTPRIPVDRPWIDRIDTTVGGRSVIALSPVASVVHLAAHAVNLAPSWDLRLLHLCDLAWTIEVAGTGLDRDDLERTATAWRCTPHLHLALRVIRRLFPGPSRIDELAPPPRRFPRPIDALATPARIVDQVQRRPAPLRAMERLTVGALWEMEVGRSPLARDGIARRGLRRLIPALERRRAG